MQNYDINLFEAYVCCQRNTLEYKKFGIYKDKLLANQKGVSK